MRYSVKHSGVKYYVYDNYNNTVASSYYYEERMAEKVCDRLNLNEDLKRI